MSEKGKKWLILVIIILILGFGGIYFIYNNVILDGESVKNNNDADQNQNNINNEDDSEQKLVIKYEMKEKKAIEFDYVVEGEKEKYIRYPEVSGNDKTITDLNYIISQNVEEIIKK